jgi:hypothetical protein
LERSTLAEIDHSEPLPPTPSHAHVHNPDSTVQNQTHGDRVDTAFIACAIVGGTLLIGQFLLSLLGIGHDTDAGHDVGHHELGHDSTWFTGLLSLRAITSAILLFGLCGMYALTTGQDVPTSLGYAVLGGVVGLVFVAQLMRFLHGLSEEGNVDIESSVGTPGTVYLTVPGNRSSAGKVHLNLQNRTVEYQAVTANPDPLPTGSRITVVAVINSDTVEVTPEHSPEAQVS